MDLEKAIFYSMNMKSLVTALFFFFLSSFQAVSQEEDYADMESKNMAVYEGQKIFPVNPNEIARKRLYPGGVDEESLVVQKPLYVPWRSLNLINLHKETLEEIKKEAEEEAELDDDEKTGLTLQKGRSSSRSQSTN